MRPRRLLPSRRAPEDSQALSATLRTLFVVSRKPLAPLLSLSAVLPELFSAWREPCANWSGGFSKRFTGISDRESGRSNRKSSSSNWACPDLVDRLGFWASVPYAGLLPAPRSYGNA